MVKYFAIINCLCCLIAILIAMPVLADDSGSSSAVIQREPVKISPGLRMNYEAYSYVHPYRPPVREDFQIEIREKWPGGVAFQYTALDKVIGESTGMESLSSIDDCPNLDPWWEPLKVGHDDRCELWASRRVYMEIAATGKSWMNVDTAVRKDSSLRWELVGSVRYLCEVNGRPVLLNALLIHTSRNDEIIMLDDPDNPLILHIKSMYFAWDIRNIFD